MATEDAPLYTPLFTQQARVDKLERYDTGYKYGEMSPQSLSSYLRKSEEGYLDDWPNICVYALETDSHLSSLIQTRVDRVAQAPFQIVPGKSHKPEAQAQAGKAAEFVRDVLSELDNFEARVKSILDSIGTGVSAHEMQWTRRGGANIVSDIIWRHPRRFRWDDQWILRLYDSGTRGTPGEPLLPDKWIVHVSQDRPAYPGRAGVIRVCIWPWLFRRWCTRYWMHATERYGQPQLHAFTPENATDAVKNKVLTDLENLSYDSVGVFEQGVEIVYNGGPGTAGNGEMFLKFMDHAKAEMSAAVLGAEDITTPGTHGSQSAVDTRVEATLDPRTASDAKALAATLRQQMFQPLLKWNLHLFDGIMPPVPKMKYAGLEMDDDESIPEVARDDTVQKQPDADMPKDDTVQPEGSAEEQIEQQAVEEGVAVSPDTALNGAQVTALLEVLSKVGAGEIPRNSAIEIIVSAFPIDHAQAEKMIGEMGAGFKPAVSIEASRVKKNPVDSTTGSNQTTLDYYPYQNPIKKVLLGE